MHDSLLERPTLDPAKPCGSHILSTASLPTGKSILSDNSLRSPCEIGSFIQTYTGLKFPLFECTPDDIFIEDIAHGLSNLCRFSGQCLHFYSVAEHCCLLSDVFERHRTIYHALWALLHDSSEAYVVDIPKPLKACLPGYKEIEDRIMLCVAEHFDLAWPEPDVVRVADRQILRDEFDQNMLPNCWAPEWEGLGIEVKLWRPEIAEREFLRRFHDLNGRRFRTRIHENFSGEIEPPTPKRQPL